MAVPTRFPSAFWISTWTAGIVVRAVVLTGSTKKPNWVGGKALTTLVYGLPLIAVPLSVIATA
ncbi:MAG: hypothetical protein OEZ42_09950, partial [Gemmatimonadota bacterium]|nr:hypothetical protein [Gemmatimonadota bacterium]